MPFVVEQTNLLKGIRPGDHVRFELVVTKDDSWISRITVVGRSHSDDFTQRSVTAGEGDELQPGEAVPDFTLTDQDGHSFRLTDFRGKAALVTFVYTRCPLPNYCPLMSRNFATLQGRLGKEFAGKFHLITVSFDPEHDTPAVLKSYAEAFTQNENSWTFATGTKQQVAAVASQFGLVYLPEAGSFTHDLRTALISPQGRLIHIWRSNVWTTDEVRSRVAEVLRPIGRAPTPLAAARANSSANP